MTPTTGKPYGTAALDYWETGWRSIIPAQGKNILISGVTGRDAEHMTMADIVDWTQQRPDLNIALRLPQGVIGIDVDAYQPKHGLETLAKAIEQWGPLPPTWRSTSRHDDDPNSGIYYYRIPAETELVELVGIIEIDGLADIELIQPHHRYAIAPPSIHPTTGQPYIWLTPGRSPANRIPSPDEMPALPDRWLQALTKPAAAERSGNPAVYPEQRAPREDWHPSVTDQVSIIVEATTADPGSRHDRLLKATATLARYERIGLKGATTALEAVHDIWATNMAADRGSRTQASQEATDAITGGRQLISQTPTTAISDQEARQLLNPPPTTSHNNLPDQLWDARPHLNHIRQAAHSRGRSADAVLGITLARIAAHTSHQILLPPIVGGHASLNTIHALVGASGAGKTSAMDIARNILQPTQPTNLTDLDSIPLGSGEGLIEAYHQYENVEGDSGKRERQKTQKWFNALFVTDEIEQLAAQAGRNGATLMATLRTAWSGGLLGQTNATEERNRRLHTHRYRFALIVGVQPLKAGSLVGDSAGGTPQRFVWWSATDPHIPPPGQRPNHPGPIRWTPPPLDAYHIEDIAIRHGIVDIPEPIADQIRWNDHHRQTGERAATEAESHRDLSRLKTAALLATLDQRPNINEEDWQIADTIIDTSMALYAELEATQQAIATQATIQAARKAVAVDEAVTEAGEARAIDSAVETTVKRARRMYPETMTRRDASRAQTRLGRGASIDEALDIAVTKGLLKVTDGGWKWVK